MPRHVSSTVKYNSAKSLVPNLQVQCAVVKLILDRKTEKALDILSSFYKIIPPDIRVGTIKGKRKTVYAVYVPKERRIYALNSDIFYNPFIILHEYYHHLRSQGTEHRGSEGHADNFARQFLNSYLSFFEAGHSVTQARAHRQSKLFQTREK